MAGSTYGTIFRITTWGESHGKALGVVVDGCPSGLPLVEADIQRYLDRRKPGGSSIATQRREADEVEILSGVFNGVTTGTPISLMVRNTDQISKDYDEISFCYRPGHADYTYDEKYSLRDTRGGGRASGRETVGRVAAGAIAAKLLKELGIRLTTYACAIGPVRIDKERFSEEAIRENAFFMPDAKAAEEAAGETAEYLEESEEYIVQIKNTLRSRKASGESDNEFRKTLSENGLHVMKLKKEYPDVYKMLKEIYYQSAENLHVWLDAEGKMIRIEKDYTFPYYMEVMKENSEKIEQLVGRYHYPRIICRQDYLYSPSCQNVSLPRVFKEL